MRDEPEYFVIKMGDHPLELPPKRRDWHLTHLQASAILLLAMGALTGTRHLANRESQPTLVATMSVPFANNRPLGNEF